MAKSLTITYFLWFTLGWLGIHHFYLRRDRQAFTWWCSLGGFFGFGWFRDSWRITEYVRDCNEDAGFMRVLTARMRNGPPSFNPVRFAGEIIIGYTFGLLGSSFIPEEYVQQHKSLQLVVPLFIAVGVHLVGNIGRETVSFKWCVAGAYLGLIWLWNDRQAIAITALLSAVAANAVSKGWKRRYDERSVCKRLVTLTLCGAIYLSLWSSAFYHNVKITTEYGEQIKVKDALEHFFNSPAWREMKDSLWQLWEDYKKHGYDKTSKEFFKKLDPEGEWYAHEVLGVSADASEDEIHTAYKSLVKQWHPDRVKDPALKEQAAAKFMEIQKAYENLSKIKSRRKPTWNMRGGERVKV